MLNEFRSKVAKRLATKIQKWCGIKGINAQLDTLRFILNNSGGNCISHFPKATGLLRETQLADTELLRIIHEVFKKHHLDYWLDFGTLLGAVRHGGFIPWDDDMDIAMPSKDYYKIMDIIPHELGNLGVTLKQMEYNNMHFIKVAYKKTIWVDIFLKQEFNEEIVYPLIETQFEDYLFYAPQKSHQYLVNVYGDYMNYPKVIQQHCISGKPLFLYSAASVSDEVNALKRIRIL